MTDQPTLAGLLHELVEASIQHGRAIERGDDGHAEKAHRAAVRALERVLLRADPARVADARAILFRAETQAAR